MSAQTKLTPLHLELIRELADEAVKRGYLTPEPSFQSRSSVNEAERVELHEVIRAA